jgi:predicted AAA+ superfamily ATPase
MLKKALGSRYSYVTFDDINNVDFFHRDPEGFMDRYYEKTIFDEVQYVPEIFRYVKIRVDEKRNVKGNFILTGSSQFSFIKNVTESLAGRIGLLSLLPFEYSELRQRYRDISLYMGSYPELSQLNYKDTDLWYSSYVNTYIERDLRSLQNIGDLRDFSVFMKLLAARTAQFLNLSELSKEIGVAVNTIKRWVSALEASYVIFLLPPYYRNPGKRLIKRPKVYFYDTGVVSFLTGLNEKRIIERSPLAGSFFENYIISEILKRRIHAGLNANLYFMKTSNGVEVDVIIEDKNNIQFIEIKNTSTFRTKIIRNIELLKPGEADGVLIYKGKNMEYKKSYHIVNYKNYLTS